MLFQHLLSMAPTQNQLNYHHYPHYNEEYNAKR